MDGHPHTPQEWREYWPEIGDRIRRVRESMSLSKRAFAERLGTDHGTLSKIENGKRGPSPVMIMQIASLSQCGADFLLFGREDFMPVFRKSALDLVPRKAR